MLKITHSYGFFSCCSVRLDRIVGYFNQTKNLPDTVDSSQQFDWYKLNTKRDITFDYFDNYDNYTDIKYTKYIDYYQGYQFQNFYNLKYSDIMPFVEKYFSPSVEIKQMIAELEEKYHIQYDNICVLFYRGNDKITEMLLSSYGDYITYAKEIMNKNPQTIFFIQSDETEFINTMVSIFPNNSFYMKDEIRHINKCCSTVDKLCKNEIDRFSKLYLAITIIMSKCKYIVCGSGNCSIWIMLYRGNSKNVYQFKDNFWITPRQ